MAGRSAPSFPKDPLTAIRGQLQQLTTAALAIELQRLEGADGPTIRACARIETAAFELASAIEALLESGEGMALARILVGLESRAAATSLSPDQIARQLGPATLRLPELAGLFAQLSEEYRHLREAHPQIAVVLSIATQTAPQSGVTQRLEQAMQDLDRLLGGLAADYRALTQSAQRPQDKAAARQRLAAEAPLWHEAARLLAAPLALVPDALVACPDIGPEGRADDECRALLRA